MSNSLRPHESQHARPPCPSPTPGVHSDSCPSSRWCHPTLSSSVVPFSSCPQWLIFHSILYIQMLYTCATSSLSIHPSVNIQVISMSWVLRITLLRTRVRVTFWRMVSSGYVPRSRVAGPHGSALLSFLRDLHTIFHSGCTNSRSHRQCRRLPFFRVFSTVCLLWTFWWWPCWPVWGST